MRETADRPHVDSAATGQDRRAVVQSVARALDVLDLLRSADAPMPAAEIANVTGLDRTVVYRLLRTMAQREMISELDATFALGPASLLLGQRYLDNLPLRRIALPYMIDLQTKVLRDRPWTLALWIPVGDLCTVIERMWTTETPLGLVLDLGDTLPLDRSAAGRSMLAYRDEADIRELVHGDPDTVLEGLDEIRTHGGVVTVDGSTTKGLQAVACAIRRADDSPIASIGVGGVDLGDQLAPESSLATQLRHVAEAIGRMIR